MADPIFSPDGKWMWTGSDWIPAPPSSSQSANVNLHDSVVGGDVHITQNSVSDFIAGIDHLLKKIGFDGQSSPTELTPSQEVEVEQVLEISEQLAGHGIEIDPWTEITLGNAADLAGRTHSAQQHYLRALETFRKNGDREGEASSLNNLGNIAKTRGDLVEAERLHRESLAIEREFGNREGEASSLNNLGNIASTRGDLVEAERLHRESLAIKREFGNREGEAMSLNNLGNIAKTRGDLVEAERLYRESLAINREIGNRGGEATSLIYLGNIAYDNGDMDERHRCYTEAVRIQREIGTSIQQWFIDNGY
jgi:tetratricopeptide (TPR) repeat protein